MQPDGTLGEFGRKSISLTKVRLMKPEVADLWASDSSELLSYTYLWPRNMVDFRFDSYPSDWFTHKVNVEMPKDPLIFPFSAFGYFRGSFDFAGLAVWQRVDQHLFQLLRVLMKGLDTTLFTYICFQVVVDRRGGELE